MEIKEHNVTFSEVTGSRVESYSYIEESGTLVFMHGDKKKELKYYTAIL
jgi:hypothetical protein